MSTLKLTVSLLDGHFEETPDGGEDFVLTFKTPVIGPSNREVLGSLSMASPKFRWQLSLQRQAEYEDETVIGSVCSFGDGQYSFMVPVIKAGQSGFPIGAFVVTGRGIVGAIIRARAEAGEIARRLIEVGALVPERVLAEQPAVEYTAVMVGGMVTTMTGMAYYYRPPIYMPSPLDDVRAGVQAPFFALNGNKQATQLTWRLAGLLADKRLDAYIAAAILLNAARTARHDPQEYAQAILDCDVLADDYDRVTKIQEAMLSMPDAQAAG